MSNESTTMPLVSVIIAAYDSPDYLNQALESVTNQTFRDYEIIVVDDCSPEESVRGYNLPEGTRLIRLEKNHGYGCPSRNEGIKAARGKYIAFLDQDDIWLPEKLETHPEDRRSQPGRQFGNTKGLESRCLYSHRERSMDEARLPLPIKCPPVAVLEQHPCNLRIQCLVTVSKRIAPDFEHK